jgi:hypothetical protein
MRAASAITMPKFHAKLVTRSIVITIQYGLLLIRLTIILHNFSRRKQQIAKNPCRRSEHAILPLFTPALRPSCAAGIGPPIGLESAAFP